MSAKWFRLSVPFGEVPVGQAFYYADDVWFKTGTCEARHAGQYDEKPAKFDSYTMIGIVRRKEQIESEVERLTTDAALRGQKIAEDSERRARALLDSYREKVLRMDDEMNNLKAEKEALLKRVADALRTESGLRTDNGDLSVEPLERQQTFRDLPIGTTFRVNLKSGKKWFVKTSREGCMAIDDNPPKSAWVADPFWVVLEVR